MQQQNFHPSIPDFCLNEWKLAAAIYDVPRLPGLYAIYSDCSLEECLYVGKSESSIRTRLASLAHKPWLMATSRFSFPIILYRIIQSANHRELCFHECLAIAVLRPLWNFGDISWADDEIIEKERHKRIASSQVIAP